MAYTKGMIKELHNRFRDTPFTYKDAGIHFATLNAAANRGYLAKQGNQYQVTARGLLFNRIEELYTGRSWISLRKQNHNLGMYCIVKGADVLDAWDKPYDLTDVIEYGVEGTEWYKIFPEK